MGILQDQFDALPYYDHANVRHRELRERLAYSVSGSVGPAQPAVQTPYQQTMNRYLAEQAAADKREANRCRGW